MSWRLTVIGIAAAVVVCAGKQPKEVDVLTITHLRILKDGGCMVCYEPSADTYKEAILEVMEIMDSGNEALVEETHTDVESAENCITFLIVDLTIMAAKKVRLFVNAINKDETKKGRFGYRDLQMPTIANYPETIKVERIGATGAKKSIRLNTATAPSHFYIGTLAFGHDCPIAFPGSPDPISKGPPCYYMNTPREVKPLYMCADNIFLDPIQDTDIVLLCADIDATDDVTNFPDEESGIKAVTLNHKEPNKITFIPVDSLNGNPTNVELVIQDSEASDGAIENICPLGATTGDCEFTILDSKTYDILVVYTDGTDVKTFDKTSITNRNLQGEKLTAGVIEGTWSIDDNKSNKFQIERTPNPEASFNKVDVDCSHLTTLCHIYFVGLTVTEYTLTLGAINNWPTIPAETDPEQEMSALIPVTKRSKAKDIDIENIQVKQDVVNKTAKFEFDYHHEIINKTTQYEIILINHKGNWKKSVMKTTFDENQEYSASIVFPLEQLDKDSDLMMLVVERDINSGKVVASGEKTLQVSAIRASKPAIDNGSNGSTSTLAIVGAAIGGIAFLMALVAAAVMFVMKIKRDNNGLQYPLHRTNIEQDFSYIHGLDNPIPTM